MPANDRFKFSPSPMRNENQPRPEGWNGRCYNRGYARAHPEECGMPPAKNPAKPGQKKVRDRSSAAKKGWETRRRNGTTTRRS